MNVVQLRVNVVGGERVDNLKSTVDSLQNARIRINVDTQGLQALDNKTLKSLNSITRLINAEVKAETQNAKTARTQANLAIQVEKTAQAQARAQTQAEKTRTAQANLAVQTEKTATAQANLAVQMQKTAQVQTRAQTQSEKLAQKQRELGDESQYANDKVGSLFENIKKFATWYLIGGIVSGVTRSFSDALKMMKAVDDELVVVRKVSNLTTNELKALEKQAYATASAYGAAADKFLSSVSAFSRAGYGKLAEQLAELSVKTQLVGDTDADTANQFLLSVDAAYQYRGEVEKLNKVLDGANELDNKYATSIQKIAEGIGIVAPVAKQAHMEIDELTAAVGTITAVTQRSGSEAARALRALILNIVGDTKTEIDEGVTWTTGEIAGLRDVIKLYASDAYKAAEATGSIINPMEAIAGLAKSMKEGLLTEQELMSMVSDIGGKLRTSQLLALIQHWDMYQSMLTDYGKAIGSADREVANALDSWTRKSEILNNKWTAFISNIVDTDVIKGGLDVLIGFIDLLDTSIGRAVVTSVAFGGAAVGIVAGVKAITTAMTALNMATLANPIFLGVAGVTLTVAGTIALFDALTTTYEEQLEVLNDLTAEYNERFGKDSEYEKLKSHEEDLLEIEKEKLRILEAEKLLKEQELYEARRKSFDLWQYETGVGRTEVAYKYDSNGQPMRNDDGTVVQYDATRDIVQLNQLQNSALALDAQFRRGLITFEDYRTALGTLLLEHEDYAKGLEEHIEFYDEFTVSQKKILDGYQLLLKIYGEASRANETNNEQISETDKRVSELTANLESYVELIKQLNAEIDNLQAIYNVLQATVDEYNESGLISVDTYQDLLALEPKYLSLITEENGRLKLNEQAYKDLQRAQAEKLAVTQAQKLAEEALALMLKKDYTGLDELVSATKISTDVTWDYVDALIAEIEALSIISGTRAPSTMTGGKFNKPQAIAYDYGTTSRMTDTVDVLKERIRLYREMSSVVDTATTSEEESANTTDKKLEALQEVVALRESELTLLERQEASSDDQVSKIKEIQAAIKDQIDYMTSIGASQTEINNLTAEWYQWQGKIKDLLESDSEALAKYQADLWRELENAINSTIEKTDKERDTKLNSLDAQLDKAQQLRDAQLEALDSQLEAQKLLHDNQMSALDAQLEALQNERDVKDDQLALEERILAVQEAQAALANAQAQRTVRYFNAATGAWEWGANAKNVKDAQEALKNAQKDLSDFRNDLAHNEAVRAIEDKKTAIQAAYDFIVTEIKNRQNSIDAQYDATERDIKRQKSQINSAYDALTSQWQMIGASMEVPARSITDILNDIATYGTPQMKTQIENVNLLLSQLGLYLSDFLGVYDTGSFGLGSVQIGATSGGTSGTTDSGVDLSEIARQVIRGYWGNGSARRNALTQAGFDYDEIMAIVNSMLASGVYDSGGVLKGLGGIKATREDEIVLPPDITRAMLSPSADTKFNARLSELHYLYGIGGNRPHSISEGVATKYGDQHNGDVYNYGDITLTENQAQSMSVYDLARLSGSLNIYSDK